ncbi:MAG: hypothetical protein R3B47_04185 [Bacteroidia bacterium]
MLLFKIGPEEKSVKKLHLRFTDKKPVKPGFSLKPFSSKNAFLPKDLFSLDPAISYLNVCLYVAFNQSG